MHHHPLEGPTPGRSETEEVPQNVKCLLASPAIDS